MTAYIEKRVFKLKLLTPVHISDGYEGDLIPTEYVVTDSGQLHKIDLSKLIQHIPEDRMVMLNEYLEHEDIIGIRNFVKLLWKENRYLFSDSIEYSMNAGDLQGYYANLEDENEACQLTVTPFIRTAKRAFIPGSSVKGAIRTAFITELFKNEKIAYALNSPNINRKAQTLEANTLHYSDRDNKGRLKINVTKDPFKALKVSDSFLPPDNSIIKKVLVVRKINDSQFDIAGMKEMKIFSEFINKEVEVDLNIRLDSRYFEIPWKIGTRISFKQITDSCKAFYERVLNHETKEFFSRFDKQVGKSRVSDLYEELLTLNARQNSFLLRIGRHCGRNSLSFNLLNKKRVEPKSRKLIMEGGEHWPVGWVCVTEL
jgi:CRISPR-associated protein Csm5